MAGFRKARAEQAALKLGLYGPAGSGKTLTALLLAEGLARKTGTRFAMVDTERGSDFYTRDVAERTVHPAGFDFDALYTRSLTEALDAVAGLRPADHGVVVIDSLTHLWEAAIAAYVGRKTRADSIPMHAWGKIKKPYKDLIHRLLGSPLHVILCGRQGNEYGEDQGTGELKVVGLKMKAEGETAYEPHVLLRMEAAKVRGKRDVHVAHVEKDRSGLLAGRVIEWPSYDNVAAPLLGLLSGHQASLPSEDDAALADAEALARAEREAAAASRINRDKFDARFRLADSLPAVERIGKEITPALKRQMLRDDIDALRQSYHDARARFVPGGNGPAHAEADPAADAERRAIAEGT